MQPTSSAVPRSTTVPSSDVDPSRSVFFGNVPKWVSDKELRHLFLRSGPVVALRVFDGSHKRPAAGAAAKEPRDSKYGFCDFADTLSAQAAAQRLNGHVFGVGDDAVKMKVTNADRKRGRDGADGIDGPALAILEPLVPRSAVCPPTDPLQTALSRIPLGTLYEAVEQLRALAADSPSTATKLLEDSPQLRVAVTLILQHAKILPYELPEEATVDPVAESTLTADAAKVATSSTAEGASNTAAAAVQALEQLSEEEVAHIMALSDDDLNKLTDSATRAQLLGLRTEFRRLAGTNS